MIPNIGHDNQPTQNFARNNAEITNLNILSGQNFEKVYVKTVKKIKGRAFWAFWAFGENQSEIFFLSALFNKFDDICGFVFAVALW